MDDEHTHLDSDLRESIKEATTRLCCPSTLVGGAEQKYSKRSRVLGSCREGDHVDDGVSGAVA